MTVRYGPDERTATRTCWEFPEFMRTELMHYAGLDRVLEDGARCASCAGELRYPLVEIVLDGWRQLLHPGCARETGRSLLDDVKVIEHEYGEQSIQATHGNPNGG